MLELLKNSEETGLQELFYELYDQYKKRFEDQKKRFELDLNNLPFPPIGADHRLKEVLGIFLENAIKYTFAGCKVVLGAKKMGRKVYVYVSDDGMGMDDETARNIHDWHYQAEAKAKGKRNGIGIYGIKGMLDKWSIRLTVKNGCRCGNEFGLLFPA